MKNGFKKWLSTASFAILMAATDLLAFLEGLTDSNVDILVSDAFAAPAGDQR
ncbi:hypothetical protein [Methylomonas sp. TEB]|uniref:hypothetical protein n=1 Tax=Methylomonas sp. TEB TaxID=3398229 RepID=UPI0039F49E0E